MWPRIIAATRHSPSEDKPPVVCCVRLDTPSYYFRVLSWTSFPAKSRGWLTVSKRVSNTFQKGPQVSRRGDVKYIVWTRLRQSETGLKPGRETCDYRINGVLSLVSCLLSTLPETVGGLSPRRSAWWRPKPQRCASPCYVRVLPHELRRKRERVPRYLVNLNKVASLIRKEQTR